MARELHCSAKGKCGAQAITVTDIFRGQGKKVNRSQVGKMHVQKCSIVWYDGSETPNNRYCVTWDQFIEFMKKYPAVKE